MESFNAEAQRTQSKTRGEINFCFFLCVFFVCSVEIFLFLKVSRYKFICKKYSQRKIYGRNALLFL